MKHIYYICNLQAGKAEIGSHLGTVLDMMTKAGYEVTVHPTQSQLDAAYSAQAAADSGKYDLIFCSGGDGTLNETMCGLFRSKNDLALGYIPCGSVNDFARSIGIPREIPRACAAALDGIPRRFDIGMANGRCFNYITAFGAFTDVTYETPQAVKNVLGQAAYIINAMTKIGSIQAIPMRITCDGCVIEDEFAFGMVTNASSVGGVLDISDFYFDDGTGAKRYQDRGVWILREGKPERITVELGVSDDNNTEVKSVELKIGDEVIVSQNQAGEEKMKMRMRMPR